jgi:hypothetical protein
VRKRRPEAYGSAPAPKDTCGAAAQYSFVSGDNAVLVLHNATGGAPALITAQALSGKPALPGYLPTGRLPHQLAVVTGGRTLLVTRQSARQLEAVTIAYLP